MQLWVERGDSRLTVADGSLVHGGLESLHVSSGSNPQLNIAVSDSTLGGGVDLTKAGSASSLILTNSTLDLSALPGSGGPLLKFGNVGVNVDASNTVVLPLYFKEIEVLDSIGGSSVFNPGLVSTGGAFAVSQSADKTTARYSGFVNDRNTNARRLFGAFAEYAQGNLDHATLKQAEIVALSTQPQKLTAESYAMQTRAAFATHQSVVDQVSALAYARQGGAWGIGNAWQSSLALSPDKAFGQGRMLQSLNSFMADTARSQHFDQHPTTGLRQSGAENSGLLGAWQPSSGEARRLVAHAAPDLSDDRAPTNHFFGGYIHGSRDESRHGGYAGQDYDNDGLVLGYAADLTPEFKLGIFVGKSTGDGKARELDAKIESENYHLGALWRYTHLLSSGTGLRFSGNFAYSNFDNDIKRNTSGTVKGSFEQKLYGAGLEAALDLNFDGTRVSPFVGLDYVHLKQDGLTEKGPAALSIASISRNRFDSSLGVSASRDFIFNDIILTPNAALSWRHQFGDTWADTVSHFVGYNTGFTSRSPDAGRDAVLLGLSVDALLVRGKTPVLARLGYGFSKQKYADEQTVFVGLETRF
ncbi:hypothetical protein FACS1894116_13820 [Betaproteobacteria bacterium]|nr:hypothetical protein FACS1894116_13820 [Betaproteobacteria bacterium]GHU01104.1 hypothetical protein FACS1894154_10930 [Betaproteobacteria bacterium]GHU27443.1 hypothetical protein FACS189497_00660 [Betaproteobacteria bacterium]